jgi:hypothetical protein
MFAAKVIPDGPVCPKFKRPVPTSPPLNEFDSAYLARKAQVPEQILRLKSGLQFSYFTEGNVGDTAVVCFPAAGFGKWEYVPREPLPGIFLVAVDDMGHGNSSPLQEPPSFAESVPQVVELLDG